MKLYHALFVVFVTLLLCGCTNYDRQFTYTDISYRISPAPEIVSASQQLPNRYKTLRGHVNYNFSRDKYVRNADAENDDNDWARVYNNIDESSVSGDLDALMKFGPIAMSFGLGYSTDPFGYVMGQYNGKYFDGGFAGFARVVRHRVFYSGYYSSYSYENYQWEIDEYVQDSKFRYSPEIGVGIVGGLHFYLLSFNYNAFLSIVDMIVDNEGDDSDDDDLDASVASLTQRFSVGYALNDYMTARVGFVNMIGDFSGAYWGFNVGLELRL